MSLSATVSEKCTKISYGDLLTKAKELVSVVHNDQVLRQCMFTPMPEWMQHLRQNSNIEVQFIKPILRTILTPKIVNNTHIAVVTSPINTACSMKQKRSCRMYGRVSYNGNRHIFNNRLIMHNNSRDCQLCHSKGYANKYLPLSRYLWRPFPSPNFPARQQLVMQISDTDSFQIIYRNGKEKRTVFLNMQAVISALIIHRRIVIDKMLQNPSAYIHFVASVPY